MTDRMKPEETGEVGAPYMIENPVFVQRPEWVAPNGEPYLVDCRDCFVVHAIGEGRDNCIDGGEPADRWFTEG